MKGINVGRWILGGVVAGLIIWIIEGAASMLYMDDMKVAMEAHNLSMDMSPGFFAITVIISLLTGLTMIFFYAAARPRFGAGPKTAVIVAVALWLGAYVVSLFGYSMLGLYSGSMLVTWGAVGLVELIIAAVVGAALYKEA